MYLNMIKFLFATLFSSHVYHHHLATTLDHPKSYYPILTRRSAQQKGGGFRDRLTIKVTWIISYRITTSTNSWNSSNLDRHLLFVVDTMLYYIFYCYQSQYEGITKYSCEELNFEIRKLKLQNLKNK